MSHYEGIFNEKEIKPFLEVLNVSFNFGDVVALDNISFTLQRGSVTALIGPNGAGKSTLLRLIAGLTTPHQGVIKVDGVDSFNDQHSIRKIIAFLPDTFGLYEELTVHEMLIYAAKAKAVPESQVKNCVEETAELLRLTSLLQRLPYQLSRGQRQSVGLAMSIIHDPTLVILDEPASGLDPNAREELSTYICTMQSKGKTFIVSSHILSELQYYSNYVLALNGGRIVTHEKISSFQSHVSQDFNQARTVKLAIRCVEIITDQTLFTSCGFFDVLCDGYTLLVSFTGTSTEQARAVNQLAQKNILFEEIRIIEHNIADVYAKIN
jgi:ABC-2 type transport system ATP-binding protein